MKNLLLISIFLFGLTFSGICQMRYTDYQKVNGLNIATKWSKAKDADGVKKPALLLGLENTNDFPVNFSFDILLYYEGILRETGKIDNECLDGLKSSIGKLNGIYFVPQNFTAEQLKNSDFNFEIESVEVEKTEGCPSE